MIDAARRDAERRAAATGSADERARVLVARVREARLAQLDVELAAYCGDPAARLVLGNGPHEWLRGLAGTGLGTISPDMAPLPAWAQGLQRWGFRVMLMAAALAGASALQHPQPGAMSLVPQLAPGTVYGRSLIEMSRPVVAAVRWLEGRENEQETEGWDELLWLASGWRAEGEPPSVWYRVLAAMVVSGCRVPTDGSRESHGRCVAAIVEQAQAICTTIDLGRLIRGDLIDHALRERT